ncbi:hypothetical protein U9M48_013785 [Paspalum notatum var. saurae]|uniref:Uncharacterized protein n=1 Tax=Paspalum notatum var. saurae TaxID=547442 RepID=A0AAQ3WJW5_PASNO
MWYLNPIDRLRRIFANPAFAKLMRWWYCERTKDEQRLSHPADATQRQRFDELWNESFWRMKQHIRHMAADIDHIQSTYMALSEEEIHNVMRSDTRV